MITPSLNIYKYKYVLGFFGGWHQWCLRLTLGSVLRTIRAVRDWTQVAARKSSNQAPILHRRSYPTYFFFLVKL